MTPNAFSKFEPMTWLLVFTTSTTLAWLDRLVPGRFKHVMAFGWVEASRVWLHYEIQIGRTRVMALPEQQGFDLIALRLAADGGAGVLRMPVEGAASGFGGLGFWCVPAIKHLVGLRSGALRPDALWRDCLASGAQVIRDESAGTRAVPAESAGNSGPTAG